MAENNNHSIISIQTKTKLCSKRRNGSSIKCQHRGECFSKIAMVMNIGNEEEWARQCFQELANTGLEVEYLTTDPDSSSYRTAMQLYEDGVTSTEPKHLLDTRHVSNNHRKFIKNMTELIKYIPGNTKIERQQMHQKLSVDLADRCQAEFTQAFEKFSGETSKLKSALSYTCDAIVECYHATMIYALCIHLCV